MANYLEALRFLSSELERFSKLDRASFRTLTLEDAISSIPHPKGGSLICGISAMRTLDECIKLAISQANLTDRISPKCGRRALVQMISDRFIRDRQELTQSSADKLFSDAVKHAAKDLSTTTHYIPCILSTDAEPKRFQIGPITFEKMEPCLQRLSPAFDEYRASSTSSRSDDLTEALAYYQDFGWIAEVCVENADKESSRTKAIAAVEAAINFLHMLIGPGPAKHIKVGERFNTRYKTGAFEVSAGKISNVNITVTFGRGYHFDRDWWKALNDIGGSWALPIIGSIIVQVLDGKPTLLAQRLLDASHWYADAVQERFTAAKIVKFVTAIERLVITKKERDLTRSFCHRTSALISFPDRSVLNDRRKRLARIYNARSRFIHGSVSPFDLKVAAVLMDAEEFSRGTLWCALNYFGQDEKIMDHAITKKRLHEGFEKLVAWAEGQQLDD